MISFLSSVSPGSAIPRPSVSPVSPISPISPSHSLAVVVVIYLPLPVSWRWSDCPVVCSAAMQSLHRASSSNTVTGFVHKYRGTNSLTLSCSMYIIHGEYVNIFGFNLVSVEVLKFYPMLMHFPLRTYDISYTKLSY